MKFKIYFTVRSKKTGLELDAEYDRLGFEENCRSVRLKNFGLTIEVDKEFAKANSELFDNDTVAYLQADLSDTTAVDWENWGSVGMVLSPQNVTAERALSIGKKRVRQ